MNVATKLILRGCMELLKLVYKEIAKAQKESAETMRNAANDNEALKAVDYDARLLHLMGYLSKAESCLAGIIGGC